MCIERVRMVMRMIVIVVMMLFDGHADEHCRKHHEDVGLNEADQQFEGTEITTPAPGLTFAA